MRTGFSPWRFTFTTNDAGDVVSMIADLEGNVRTVPKVPGELPDPAVVAGNAAIDLPISAEAMARYEGTYTVSVGGNSLDLRVYVDNGRLIGAPAGQSASPLLNQGNHTFAPATAPDVRITFVLENGRATRLTFRQGSSTYEGYAQAGS